MANAKTNKKATNTTPATKDDLIKKYNLLGKRLGLKGRDLPNAANMTKGAIQKAIKEFQGRIKANGAQNDGAKGGKSKGKATGAKKAAKAKSGAKKAKPDADSDSSMTVAILARELDINPKVARAKLRRRGYEADGGRWPSFERDDAMHVELQNVLMGEDEE